MSTEGFTEGHIAAQFTERRWLDWVDTAITAIAPRPTPATQLPITDTLRHPTMAIPHRTPATQHRPITATTGGLFPGSLRPAFLISAVVVARA